MKKKNYKVKLKVKELLEERNITQKKLAQISGIRESTISDIVRGTRTVINFEHLRRTFAGTLTAATKRKPE